METKLIINDFIDFFNNNPSFKITHLTSKDEKLLNSFDDFYKLKLNCQKEILRKEKNHDDFIDRCRDIDNEIEEDNIY